MTEERTFANLVAKIKIDLPEQEQQKLNAVQEQAPRMEKAFGSFARGGAAIFAAFSAVALLFGAGGGFRSIIDLLFQTVSLLSAIFVAPFIQSLIGVARDVKKFSDDIEEKGGGFGGFLGAVNDRPLWQRVGAVILGTLVGGLLAALGVGGAVTAAVVGLGVMLLGVILDTEKWKAAGQWIWNGLKKTWEGIKKLGGWIWDGLVAAWDESVAAVKGVGGWIWDGLVNAWNESVDFAKNIGESIGSWISDNIDPVQWAKDFVNWLRGVNWMSVFTFDIPGVDVGGAASSAGDAGSDAVSWLAEKWDSVTGASS